MVSFLSWWPDFSNWLGSWWNFSSFGPDVVVAVFTGVVVGLVVLRFEKRVSDRARALEITNAQGLAVERARSLLRHPLSFTKDATPYLHVQPSQLERLQTLVRAVPRGEAEYHVTSYHWAARVVDSFEELESLADALDTRIAAYDKAGGSIVSIGYQLHRAIGRLATEWPLPTDWSWDLDSGVTMDRLAPAIHEDHELRATVEGYLRTRRLLEAHREAFLASDGTWRAEEWAALIAKTRGAPRSPITRWRRQRTYNKAVRQAKAHAEELSTAIVLKVDGMAY